MGQVNGWAVTLGLESGDVALQQAIVIAFSIVEQGFVHVDGGAVVGVDEGKTQHHGVNLGENVANGPKVAKGLAHFFAVDVDEAVVEPVVNHGRVPGVTLALENLCLMVGEAKIVASAVDVKFLVKVVEGHGRALDVPAGTPWPLSLIHI